MRVFPENAGGKWHIALVRQRAFRALNVPDHRPMDLEGASRPLGVLGRFWTKGLKLEDRARAKAVAAAGPIIGWWSFAGWLSTGLCGLFAAAALADGRPEVVTQAFAALGTASATGFLLALPRRALRRLHRTPLAAGEVEALLPLAADDLERAYLTLLRDAIRQEAPASAEAGSREALETLGEAITRLPAVPAAPEEAAALHEEAAALAVAAGSEADPVVAASLERQAGALRQMIEVAARSERVSRQTAVLRSELATQIKALHAGLAALQMGAADGGHFARMAETVQQVARDAVSVAAAREELDAAAGPALPVRATGTPEIESVPLRSRHG